MTDAPSIAAGIVTFNPDLGRLRENVEAILPQVSAIIIVDNNSSNSAGLTQFSSLHEKISLVFNDQNRGISKALNQVMRTATHNEHDWVVLLDQDSVASVGLVQGLFCAASADDAVVAPEIIDRNVRRLTAATDVVAIDYCITSGALYSTSAWAQVGGYDENLFIDFVDFDYCLRLRLAGFSLHRNRSVEILHEIGKITQHGPFKAYNHSAFRNFHMAQDMIYYARKHKATPKSLRVGGRGLGMTYVVLFRKAVIVLLFEDEGKKRAWALARGITQGTKALLHA